VARFRADRNVWQAEVYHGVDDHGAPLRIRKAFKTKAEALRFEANPASFLGSKVTVREIFRKGMNANWKGTRDEKDALRITEELIELIGADVDPAKINNDTVKGLIAQWQDEENTSGTINRKLSKLSMLLKYAKEQGAIVGDLPNTKRLKEAGRDRLRFLTEDEAERIRNSFRDSLMPRFYDFLLYTGCRTSEALKLGWHNVTRPTANRPGSVRFEGTKGGGKHRFRTIPLVPQAFEALDFTEASPWGAVKYDTWHKEFHRARYLAGVRDEDVVPYTLRHTCASWMVQRGVPLAHIQKWLGHEKITTTLIYAKLADGDLLDAAGILSGMGKTLVPDLVPVVPEKRRDEQSSLPRQLIDIIGE